MDQFQVFTIEKLIQTYDKYEGKMNRNDIYNYYSKWFYDNILENAIYDDNNYILRSEIYKYGKIIGRVEFYKFIIQVYGQAPLINRKTKQYSYYFKKIV